MELTIQKINSKILTIREIKVLNQAVKRNFERFPEGFMFQLFKAEVDK